MKVVLLLMMPVLMLFSCQKSASMETGIEPDELVFQKTFESSSTKVEIFLSSKKISFVKPLYVKIRVRFDEKNQIQPVLLSSQYFQKLNITNRPKEQQTFFGNETKEYQILYQLEATETGKAEIKSFPITMWIAQSKDGAVEERLLTETIEIEVFLPESLKEGKLKPLRGEIQPPFYWMPILIWIAISVVATLIWFWWMQKEPESREVELEPISYIDWANDALRVLEKKELIEKGVLKEYYTEISYILRHFLEKHLELPAEEQTTEEFLDAMTTSSLFTEEQKFLLKEFMKVTDLVKFAEFLPDSETSRQAKKIAWDLVNSF